MATLEELGFSRYRTLEGDVCRRFKQTTGYDLPEAYVDFLAFQEPESMPLSFKFLLRGEQWEGQVTEFFEIAPHADDLDGLEHRVVVRSGEAYLPIACDAGGNYLYLNLTRPEGPVVDVDYSSGTVSEIAPNFRAFLDRLYPSRE